MTWSIIFILASLLVACAPQAALQQASTPTIAPVPKTLGTQGATPTSNLPLPTSQDAAWQKVLEAAKKEGKVTAYSYNWVGDIGLDVKNTFESSYGINLDIITGRGAEFTERLKTERRLGQRTGDMTEGSSGFLISMKSDGLLTSIATELPVLRQKDIWWVDPAYLDPVDKANLALTQQMDSPAINTNLVKPGEEPTSWKDLLDPKWKGKMSLREPRLNAILFAMFVALLDKKVWDENYIKALYKQDLKYGVSTIEEMSMLSKGEIHMSALGSGNAMTRFVAQGAPVKAITLKEGEIVSSITMAAIASSPHPNATKVLLNWLLSPEGQSVVGKGQSALTVRKDVPDFRPEAARTKMANPIVVTQAYLNEGTKRYQDRWYDKLVGR